MNNSRVIKFLGALALVFSISSVVACREDSVSATSVDTGAYDQAVSALDSISLVYDNQLADDPNCESIECKETLAALAEARVELEAAEKELEEVIATAKFKHVATMTEVFEVVSISDSSITYREPKSTSCVLDKAVEEDGQELTRNFTIDGKLYMETDGTSEDDFYRSCTISEYEGSSNSIVGVWNSTGEYTLSPNADVSYCEDDLFEPLSASYRELEKLTISESEILVKSTYEYNCFAESISSLFASMYDGASLDASDCSELKASFDDGYNISTSYSDADNITKDLKLTYSYKDLSCTMVLYDEPTDADCVKDVESTTCLSELMSTYCQENPESENFDCTYFNQMPKVAVNQSKIVSALKQFPAGLFNK